MYWDTTVTEEIGQLGIVNSRQPSRFILTFQQTVPKPPAYSPVLAAKGGGALDDFNEEPPWQITAHHIKMPIHSCHT